MAKLKRASKTGERYYFDWFPLPTLLDGDIYVFLAVDEFSRYVFNLGVKNHITDQMIVDKVDELTSHPLFKPHNNRFELIMRGSEYVHDQIRENISPKGGVLIFDEKSHNSFFIPLMKQVFRKLNT